MTSTGAGAVRPAGADIHLVNLTGAAGSGKTILALAAAIEQTMVTKEITADHRHPQRPGLDEDIGFLPGPRPEKMEPWLGAITDNLEALHMDDHNPHAAWTTSSARYRCSSSR